MKKLILFFAFTVAAVSNCLAQNATPSPTPPTEGDVVKISTNLIQLDVSVTDAKGRPITDLKADEVEVYENGKKQKITNLSFISSVRETAVGPRKKDQPKIDVPIPTSEIRPEHVRRTIALVADDLSLSFESAHFTRLALKKFVDEQMQDGDLVAIIRTGAGMGSLQQFTSDKKLLYAAIERVKWNPLGTGNVSAFAAIEPSPLEQAKVMGFDISDEDLQAEKNRMNAADDLKNSIFASGTLGAIRYLVNGMSQLPGRKSIVLFSDGFRMYTRDEDGYQDNHTILDLLRKLVDFANRASVVIHTIDSRGLVYTGYSAADEVTDISPDAMIESMSERSDQLFETQQGLSFLAKETGGLAIRNNNDLSEGVQKILDDQSYYLVAYEPEDETFDPAKVKFNKLNIKVLRKGVVVRTRSGFFNTAAQSPTAQPAEASTRYRQIMDALSSPFAYNGIQLRLNPLFGYDAKNGAFVKSFLHIDGKDLKFTDTPEGKKKAVISIFAASFGEDGVPVQQVSRSYSIVVKPDELKQITEKGFIYDFTFPVKKPGGFQYRVAIRDDQAATVGSASQFVEIPKIKKGTPVLSSIVLQNFTHEQWKQPATTKVQTDPINDTSLRRFHSGTILQYGLELYGMDANAAKSAALTRKIRIFRDGRIVLDGKEAPVEINSTNVNRISISAAVSLGTEMLPGDYIMQVVVTDNSRKDKKRNVTQVVQFEIVG